MKVSKKLPTFMGATILRAIQFTAVTDEYESLRDNVKSVFNSGMGFVSIFQADEPRVKFADAQGVALAITTGMLKKIIQDATNTATDGKLTFILMDLVRYMKEVDLQAIEFSVTKFYKDVDRECSDWVPLSDRYQFDSWKKRLKMSYASYDTSGGQLYPQGVTLAEANRL